MLNKSGRRLATVAAILSAATLGACVGNSGGSSQGPATSSGAAPERGSTGFVFEESEPHEYRVVEFITPEKHSTLVYSIIDEWCVATEVANQFMPADLKFVGGIAAQFVNTLLSEEDKRHSIYCNQNFAGVILLTDESMNRSLEKAGLAIQVAGDALELNIANQQATLAEIARLRNLSLGEKLQPENVAALEKLNGDLDELSESVSGEIETLSDSDGVSPEALKLLIEAHRYFVGFRHHQGKALAGIALIQKIIDQHGAQALASAFFEAIKIDAAAARTAGKKEPDLETTEQLATAFVEALPKFARMSFAAGDVSSAIWEASDDDDYQESLKNVRSEEKAIVIKTAKSKSNQVGASAASLGLPGASSVGGASS